MENQLYKQLWDKMKTTNADMQRFYGYLDKMGVTYTVDRNPSPEKIARIKAQIEKNKCRGLQEKALPSYGQVSGFDSHLRYKNADVTVPSYELGMRNWS